MSKKPYLSFCIPTYDRLVILQNTIESIYADLDGVDLDDFEVIISDNEPSQSAKKIVEKFSYQNLKYYSNNYSGFLNSYFSLKCGKGLYLKLHNNYTKLRRGTLKKMILEVKESKNEKPFIFYTGGLNQNGKIKQFRSYDSFMFELSYFSSWSSGFGMWREDFLKVCDLNDINTFFPQTSLLLTQTNKSSYIINDKSIFDNQKIPKKGGYNIFKVFAVDYVSLINKSYQKKNISEVTFNKIKTDLLYNFLSVRYFKTVIASLDNFEKSGIKKSICINYSSLEYYLMILISLFSPFKVILRKMKASLFKINFVS